MRDALALLRAEQWVKNGFVLAPLVFAQRLGEPDAVARAALAFVAFCLASSAAYVVNDIADRERDRAHPLKRSRPLAAGRVAVRTAVILALVLAAAAFACGAGLGARFAAVLAGFLILQLVYSFVLKDVVVADVVTIAVLFVLRAAAGVVAVGARMSEWLFLCTFLLAMFLGLGKRRHEIALLGAEAGGHRSVLGRYDVRLLDQLIAVVSVTTLVVYTIYTVWPSVEAKLGTEKLYLTVPFVIFGVLRYLFLIYGREQGGSPTDLLLADLPLQLGIVGWFVTVLVLLYF